MMRILQKESKRYRNRWNSNLGTLIHDSSRPKRKGRPKTMVSDAIKVSFW